MSNTYTWSWPSGGMVDAGDLKSPPGTRGAGSSPALAIQTLITDIVKYGICDSLLVLFLMLQMSKNSKNTREVPKRCRPKRYAL